MKKTILILALLLMIVNILKIDFNALTNLDINLSAYLGVLSMFLLVLAMYFSIRKTENNK